MWNDLYLEGDQTIFKPDRHSETFVLRALNLLPNGGKVLDLGCGSGAIGLLLKKKDPNKEITFSDINEQAILDTKNNIIKNNFQEEDFKIIKSNMFENIPEQKYDLIIAYLPYLNFLHMYRRKENVVSPLTSFIVGNDSDELILLKELLINGKKYLIQNGHIFFKIKNNEQLFILSNIMKENNYSYELFSSESNEEELKLLVDATYLGE